MHTTDGILTIGGKRICATAENTQHCLPAGSYPIQFETCNQQGKKMPLANTSQPRRCYKCIRHKVISVHANMPQFCPMIKVGNGAYNHTDGSIIVGEYLQPGILIHSSEAFDKLYERIKKSVQRDTEICLTISNI